MDYDSILIFPSKLLINNKYDIRNHEIEVVFNSIVQGLNKEEFSEELLDCILYEYNMDLFSDMREICKKSVADLLMYYGIKEEYCEYFVEFVKDNTAVLSSLGNISIDFWKKHKDLLLRGYLAENPRFLRGIKLGRITEEDIKSIGKYLEEDCDISSFWNAVCMSQKLSEEFLIKYIENVNTSYIIFNQNIPKDVKQRITNLKKVIDQ